GLGLPQRGFGIVKVFLRPTRRLQQILSAIVVLLGIFHSALLHHQIGFLQIVVDGEQHVALLDLVALPHLQRFDTTLLVGGYEHQFGLDPALQLALFAVIAASEHDASEHHCRPGGKFPRHGALLAPNSNSTCVFIILRTSSGSKRSNKPLQMMATRPGAAMICGNSASASGTSPRAAARRSSARTAAMMRESTSR